MELNLTASQLKARKCKKELLGKRNSSAALISALFKSVLSTKDHVLHLHSNAIIMD
jgi:hypothetical protein